MEQANQEHGELFKPISGDEVGAQEVTEVESYCVQCGENGTTKLLLTSIPFYKEVIIASFSCPHCNYENNEIESAGETQRQGVLYTLEATEPEDLNRQLIKSDYAALKIPQLDLETPAKSQKGEITNVEGILQRIISALSQDQDRRKLEHLDDYEKIEVFLKNVRRCIRVETSFTLILRDISGNSFISTPSSILPGQKDDRLQVIRFERTLEENHMLGLYSAEERDEMSNIIREEGEEEDVKESTTQMQADGKSATSTKSEETSTFTSLEKTNPSDNQEEKTGESKKEADDLYQEVLEFPTNCPDCGAACSTKMKLTQIPFFKEVVVMATDCEKCGSRTNEVKSGSGIEEKGRRITLRVTTPDDLCRDVLKSETCSVEIPDLDFELGARLLGGKFTTLEGLLCDVKQQLTAENPLISGDSAMPEMKEKMEQFCQKFDRLISCEVPFTVILDDPAGNSYLQNVYAPDDDPEMKVEDYERAHDQNEELGLNDMNTETYTSQ